jgi:hypothetical protein
MNLQNVTTASRFFFSFGWTRFTGAGFFGVEKNGDELNERRPVQAE